MNLNYPMKLDENHMNNIKKMYGSLIENRIIEIEEELEQTIHVLSDDTTNLASHIPEKFIKPANIVNIPKVEKEVLNAFPSYDFSTPIKTSSYYKAYFNYFFHNDLYGKYDAEDNVILSTGALDQDEFQLPPSMKYFVEFPLAKNWYGYSHSLGRESARIAISDLENEKLKMNAFNYKNIALITGVTAGLYHLLSFLKEKHGEIEVLTHLPTYIPFATACEKVANTKFVDMLDDKYFNSNKIIEAITEKTRVILILADMNPLGKGMNIAELNKLSSYCDEKNIYLIFDQAGAKYPELNIAGLENHKKLIRMESMSKKISVPGMKLGYIVAEENLIEEYYEKASTCYGGPASFFYLLQECEARFNLYRLKGIQRITQSQLKDFDENYELSIEWLQTLYDDYNVNVDYFDNKIQLHRNYVVNKLMKYTPTLISEVIVPDTGINIFVKINSRLSSYDFFLELLKNKKVAVFPGICSGVNQSCWIRITIGVKRSFLEYGITQLISFLKEQFVISLYEKDPSLKYILHDIGRYTEFKDINFHTHLYDVLEKAFFLRKKNLKYHLKDDLLVDLCLCHDAGKVASVITSRIANIVKIQECYDPIPANLLNEYRDDELLYLKDDLLMGQRFEKSYFLNKYNFLNYFNEVIDWESNTTQKDTLFTNYILVMCIEEYPDQECRYQKIMNILNKGILQINLLNLEQEIDPYVILLDISDKLADFKIEKVFLFDNLKRKLDMKKKYVIWRYLITDQYRLELINEEYEQAVALGEFMMNLDKVIT
ncbi:pyridoxal phosphate-dependent aminotransferase [Paenibacillus sp. T2-29]|uniref:pyridoxal phosphate-dependent aminotransferase n=1 Tax=Paenibacillus TaxID=44249 RepID=UPI0039BC3130